MVALGSNLPDGVRGSAELVGLAMDAVARTCAVSGMLRASRLYATPCFPAGAGPDYVNAAVAFETTLDPGEIILRLHRIEADFGRERRERWASRTVDLDLIALGDRVLPDAATQTRWRDLPPEAQAANTPDELILPHPRLQDRAFVLVPLAEVAPDWRHPLLGRTVSEMRDALQAEDLAAIRPLDGPVPDAFALVNPDPTA